MERRRRRIGWALAVCGVAGVVFALVALTSPGRIDIVDGQTRYEVARSLVEEGDILVRDDRIWFGKLPGRQSQPHTSYRLPHSLVGTVAILAADLSGPQREARRHFFFSLVGSAAAALLVVAYALWFRHRGLGARAALGWAVAGIVCTPSWFYATSTFDDLLCTSFGIAAVVLSLSGAERWGAKAYLPAGALLAFALYCKPTMGAYAAVPLASLIGSTLAPREARLRRLSLLLAVAMGLAFYVLEDRFKFPPESRELHGELLEQYVQAWPGHPVAAVAGLTVSPGKGALWYFPPLLLCLLGLRRAWPDERNVVAGVVAACLAITSLICSFQSFAGDPAWGPRYLTPVFALLFLFAPEGARGSRRLLPGSLLAAGCVVQLAALAVDPHRLYVERGLPSAFYAHRPWLYFHPAISHLLQRPRETLEILRRTGRADSFTPAPAPTFAFPVLDFVARGPRAVDRYHVLSSLRPWWLSQRYLPAAERPVSLAAGLLTQITLLLASVLTLAAGLRFAERSDWGPESEGRESRRSAP